MGGDGMVLLGIITRTDLSRLCDEGPHGVEEVRNLINRKHAANAAGMVAVVVPTRGSERNHTGSSQSHCSETTTDTPDASVARKTKMNHCCDKLCCKSRCTPKATPK